MRFDAVLFDLDGTLLDTLDDIADSVNAVLDKNRFPRHPNDAYRYFIGDGVPMLMRRVLPKADVDDQTVARLVEEMREEYGRRWNVKTRAYEGVPELLDGLVQRGVQLAVLSNKPDDFTIRCVEELLSRWRFSVVAGHRRGVPPKPDPTGALEIAGLLRTLPGRVLFLGDSGIDMETAVAAGMHPVGALWGFRTREELQKSGAKAVVENPGEVLTLMDSCSRDSDWKRRQRS